MIWVPISRNSRGSSALTLPWVPTDMKTGVSTTPWLVVKRPSRAFEEGSVLSNSNIGRRVNQAARGRNGNCWETGKKIQTPRSREDPNRKIQGNGKEQISIA